MALFAVAEHLLGHTGRNEKGRETINFATMCLSSHWPTADIVSYVSFVAAKAPGRSADGFDSKLANNRQNNLTKS